MNGFQEFRPPLWLRNAHLQTVYASHKPRRWDYGWRSAEPVKISIGDEGELLGEMSWQPGPSAASPALFLLHGLEGSVNSGYMIGIGRKAYARGFHTLRVNLRNCGGTERLTPTLYCAALSRDVGSIARHLREKCGLERVYAAGVSLGGSLLLKHLGEEGEKAAEWIRGAAVMSVPLDLAAGVAKMEQGWNVLYGRHFVRRLVETLRRKAEFFPGIADMERVGRIRSLREFDDVVTAPHFGFRDAEEYYRLSSAGPKLGGIAVPTLIVQAQDDPIVPFESYGQFDVEGNPKLRLLATARGGHAGFYAASADGDPDRYWAESRLVDFLCGG